MKIISKLKAAIKLIGISFWKWFSEIIKFLPKKSKRIAALLLALITLVPNVQAFALTSGNKTTIAEKWNNSFSYNISGWTDALGKPHYNMYGSRIALFSIKSTGEPVYCLEPDKKADVSKTASTTSDFRKTEAWKKLSVTAQDIITRASIYGYDGTSATRYGYSATEAHTATQMIIWDAVMGKRTNYASGVKSWVTSCTENTKKCYNAILSAMSKHTNKVSLNKTSVVLKKTGSANAVTITDANKILSQFDIKSSNSNIKVTKSGNTLKVYCTAAGVYSGTITLTKKNTNVGSSLAIRGVNQTMLYGKIADPVTAKLTVKVESMTGSATIKKTNSVSSEAVKGATFVINQYSSSGFVKYKTLTDKGDGSYSVSGLDYSSSNQGYFYIYEEKAPTGYALNTTSNKIKISGAKETAPSGYKAADYRGCFFKLEKNGTAFSFTLAEPPWKANVEVTKTNSTDSSKKIAGATIVVRQYNKDKKSFTDYKTLTDNKNGSYSLKGLPYTEASQGYYYIYEKAAPEGYSTNTEKMKMTSGTEKAPSGYTAANYKGCFFKIEKNGTTFAISVKDAPWKGNATITKTDSKDSSKKVSGATIVVQQYNKDKKTFSDYQTLTDNKNGSYSVSGIEHSPLNQGYFYIYEKTAPTGYSLNTTSSKIKIIGATETAPSGFKPANYSGCFFKLNQNGTNFTFTINDPPWTANVSVTKTDSENSSKKVSGATIVVQQYDKNKKTFVNYQTLTDNKNGSYSLTDLIRTDSNQGYFYIYEKSAPAGYSTNTEKIKLTSGTETAPSGFKPADYKGCFFRIDKNGATFNFTVKDPPWKSSVLLYKRDIENNLISDELLKDARFYVQQFSNKDNSYHYFKDFELKTNTSTGVSYFYAEGLDYTEDNGGYFQLVEANAPLGYENSPLFIPNGHKPASTKTNSIFRITADTAGHQFVFDVQDPPSDEDVLVLKTAENGKVDGFKIWLHGTATNGTDVDLKDITDSKGRIKFTDVPDGDNYTFEEIELPDYYVQPEPITGVSIKNGKTTTIRFHNEFKRADIKVKKTSENGKVDGFKVHLFGTADCGIYVDEYGITDKNGDLWFKNVLVGTFTMEEVDVPDPYITPPSQTVTLTENKTAEIKFYNEIVRGSVKGYKVDRETNEPIKGALFGLFKANEKVFTEDTAIATDKTNRKGVFEFDEIEKGKYLIKELEPAKGYMPNNEKYSVTISEDEEIVEITVKNDKYPEIETTALVNESKDAFAAEKIILKDIVSYKHLIPGKEYTVSGVLMNKTTEEPFTVYDEGVVCKVKFVPTTPNGSIIVPFEFYASEITDTTDLVVFEELYTGRTKLAAHEDINDKNQTITIHAPTSRTLATVNGEKDVFADEEFVIRDVVSYTDLVPGREYTINGIIINKTENAPLLINGEEVKSEATFTAEQADGSVTVLFKIPSNTITENTDLVVFEELYFGETMIADHKDINDKGQTVTVHKAEIGTTAVIENEKDAFSAEKFTIEDIVTYKDLIVGKEYTVKGVLMNKATGEPFLVNDEQVTAQTTFTAENASGSTVVSFEFDASVITEKTELVAFEELYKDNILLAVHADLEDENQTVTVHTPSIHTTATINGEKDVFGAEDFTIHDEVSFSDLVPGREYTLIGTVMDKTTEKPFMVNDKPVSNTLTFTADEENGSVIVPFEFKAEDVSENTDLVVFEELYYRDVQITDHKDIDDEGQTVAVHKAEIGTTATVNGEKDVFAAEKNITLEDVVEYKYLIPGKEYTVKGVLMNKATGEPFLVDEEQVTAQTTFTAENASGSTVVTFEFDVSAITEKTEIVVFEDLYKDDVLLAVHADIEDDNQTVTVHTPTIHTTATINNSKEVSATEIYTLDDVVAYEDLIPGKEYKVSGILMNKATNEPFAVDGKQLVSDIVFIPEEVNGSTIVSFAFDSKFIKDETDIVAFETLYYNDTQLTEHSDINDEGQTVKLLIPEIKTSATINGKKEVNTTKIITVEDTISYTNLNVGSEYVVKGVLMDRATGKPFLIDGKEIRIETTFTPKAANGQIKIPYNFDGTKITKDTEIVVFETIYRDGVEIADHTDLEDKEQTVKLIVPDIPDTGDNSQLNKIIVTGTIISDAALLFFFIFYLRRKKCKEKD